MVFVARLTLQNFRSFADASLTFVDARTLIVGRNASGKSSIADAIAWCLTGRCRGLDAAGRGVSGLIRTGASTMRVSVDLMTDDGPLVVVREADASSRATTLAYGTSAVDLRRGALAEIQATIYEKLGVSQPVLATACDATAFFGLDHADAKDLLLRLLDVRVDVDGQALTLDDLDRARASAELERAAAKKALAGLGTRTPPPIPLQPPADVLREKADALRAKVEVERDTHAESRGRLVELERRQREIQTGVDSLRDQDRVVGPSFTSALEVSEHVLAHGRTQLEQLRREEPPAFIGPAAAPEWVERVAAHDPKDGCVFSASIPCKTAASHFRTYVASVAADLEAHRAQEQARASWRALVVQQEREVEKFAREVEAKRAALAKSDQMADLIEQAEAKLAAVTTEIAALRADGVSGDPVAPAPSSARTELLAVEHQLATWQAYDSAHAIYQAHVTKAAALKAEVAALEARCQVTGPRGARVQALQAALDGFLASVNAVASRWGFSFGITPDPWAVTVNRRDVALLSVSERLRVGVALQCAIVQAAGLHLAFVDAVDLLDRANNLALSLFVLDPRTEGQIVIAATREDDAALPAIDGLQAVRLLADDAGVSTIHDMSTLEVANA